LLSPNGDVTIRKMAPIAPRTPITSSAVAATLAGYDPQEFISFFEKIEALEKKRPGTISKAFATHPQTPDRIERSQEEIRSILPPRPEYEVTTSEFDDVKARLAALENKHKVIEDKDSRNPILRRGSPSNKNGSEDTSGSDDGRPR
jgi:beta-barrel assembly-enhancing protease